MPSTSSGVSSPFEWRGAKPQVSRGKPAFMTELHPDISGKGKGLNSIQRKRSDRTLDGKEIRRKCNRRKRFSLDKKGSRYRNRHVSESSIQVDLEHTGMWRPTDDLRLIVNLLQVSKYNFVI